jgi:hypothetical protein
MRMETLSVAVVAALVAAVVSGVLGGGSVGVGGGGSVGNAALAAAEEVVQARPRPAAPSAPAVPAVPTTPGTPAAAAPVRFVQIASAAWSYGYGYPHIDGNSLTGRSGESVSSLRIQSRDTTRADARVYLFGLCENGEVWAYTMEPVGPSGIHAPRGVWNRVAMP